MNENIWNIYSKYKPILQMKYQIIWYHSSYSIVSDININKYLNQRGRNIISVTEHRSKNVWLHQLNKSLISIFITEYTE